MGILEGIRRALNIGGCEITVQAQAVYPQGGSVDGVVTLKGGSVDQSVTHVIIELEEFWTETRSSGKSSRRVKVAKTMDSAVLRRNLTIVPGGALNLPFSLKLPPNSRLSNSSMGWRLRVDLNVPMAVNPTKTVQLNIGPAEEFQAIVKACDNRIGFVEKSDSWRWSKDQITTVRMLPVGVMKDDFDHIDFKFRQSNGASAVAGKISFNLQEKSFTDYLKALFMMDRIEESIVFYRNQLFNEDGSINCEEIAGIVASKIDRIAKARNPFHTPDAHRPATPKDTQAQTASVSPPPQKTVTDPEAKPHPSQPQKRTMKEIDPKNIDF